MTARCPKCRQPLDDDEEYICCAAETVAWRCTACAKVSEGFAFPYGQCPLCGGALARLDPRSAAEGAELDAVREALAIELGGRAFYTRAALDATEPAMRELFGRLAAMEGEHITTLSRRYHIERAEPAIDFAVDRAAIYAGIDTRPRDPAYLFRIAIACEERAAAFFAERAGSAAAGSKVGDLYRELAAEEREHVALLSTEYALWLDGRAGLL
jgi:rubrerythrin